MNTRITSCERNISVSLISDLGWPCGVAECSNMGDYWYLNRVVLYPQRGGVRGQGYGSRILRDLLAVVQLMVESHGTPRRVVVDPGGYVEPTPENKAKQVEFYVRNGFIQSGEFEDRYEWFAKEPKCPKSTKKKISKSGTKR